MTATPLRVGFLLNHAAAHQVAHALPIALAMRERLPESQLEVFVSAGAIEDEVRRLMTDDAGLRIVRLDGARPAANLATRLSGGALPIDRVSILHRNLHRFRGLNALVVPEKTSLLLKTRFGLEHLKMIHTRHGAGDRAIGFDKASGRFDLVLMAGAKIRDRLQANGLLDTARHAIVGYPKFDLLRSPPPSPLFDNGRPTVLYNPHPSPRLSSWYRAGRHVLDYFARSDRFNLIFAPHVMLFAKRFNISLSPPALARVGLVPREIYGLPHIHVDIGSPASVDMTYTRAADIYLGDASSQVYEFLASPRPCVFLNPSRHDWRGNVDFAHWRAGPVVEGLAELDEALGQAVAAPERWRRHQEELFAYSFDLDATPSSERAANAIADFLAA